MMNNHDIILIMAGGTGTRFWPRSRKSLPKQYLSLFGKQSLIQETVERVLPIVPPERVYICSQESQKSLIQSQLPQITNLILEPEGKNTAPCLMLSALELIQRNLSPNTVMVVLPADHYIAQPDVFRPLILKAAQFARSSNKLVTLGIIPTHAHTGYGYIEAGEPLGEENAFKVLKFVEKPDQARAYKFLQKRNFFWNGGIFIWTLSALVEAFERHMPAEWEKLRTCKSPEQLKQTYRELKSVPIDIGVLEKSLQVCVIPADMGWSDIGSWDALHGLREKNINGHVLLSKECCVDSVQSRGCLIDTPKFKNIALVGVNNLVVVEDGDTLMICDRTRDQLVREIAERKQY